MISLQIIEIARAKINLYLRIQGKRPDGYHQLLTAMQTLELCDQITLTEQANGITLTCDDPRLVSDRTNLAYQAAELLLARFPGNGVHLMLSKRIPWQAGLGGGSSDAAAVLRGLNMLWKLNLPLRELASLAAQLGSDVPYFLSGGLAMASGRGEVITPLSTKLTGNVGLIIPPFGLSTASVYQAWQPSEQAVPAWDDLSQALRQADYNCIANLLHNDLEQAAFQLRPELAEIKRRLRADGYAALLSGSGSCLFVLLPAGDAEQWRESLPDGYRTVTTRIAT